MKTNLTNSVTLFALLLATASTTQANDIVNFLNALNGNSGHRTAPVIVQPIGNHGREHGGAAHGNYRHGEHRTGVQFGSSATYRPSFNTVNLRPNHYTAPPSRSNSGLQISLQFGENGRRNPNYGAPVFVPALQPTQVLPPVPVYPSVTAYPYAAPAPFQLGQFIDCQVPLATSVQVQDECNVAPSAVPVIIAVRDPNMCAHETVERLVFVQIFVPQCPLRDLQVSPCRTRVSLDYGQYEVDIKSGNGVIVIDYDN